MLPGATLFLTLLSDPVMQLPQELHVTGLLWPALLPLPLVLPVPVLLGELVTWPGLVAMEGLPEDCLDVSTSCSLSNELRKLVTEVGLGHQ